MPCPPRTPVAAPLSLILRAVLAAALLAGCSARDAAVTPGTALPAPAASTGPGAGSAAVTFTLKWPAAKSHGRRAKYLPATAQSASIAVGTGTPQYLNNPTATLTFSAPVGLDTFLIKAYDEQNGQGNVLSRADITQKVSGTTANVVATTLNGVIASLNVALTNPAPPAGLSSNSPVTVTALDADGNTIVGPGDYDTPITLSINDPAHSGTLSLSNTLLQAPGTTVTLSYDGSTLWSASVVATAQGIAAASATITPTPTFSQFKITGGLPQSITAGPDGNMWFTDAGTNSIGKIQPSGNYVEYTIPTSEAEPYGIAAVSDGRLWFTEYSFSKIGAVTTNGSFQEYPTATPNSEPMFLLDRGDGVVWYSAYLNLGYQAISTSVGGYVPEPNVTGGIATAPDNELYFTEPGNSKIGRVSDPQFAVQELALTPASSPQDIVRGPDGNLWFTEFQTSRIGRLSPFSFTVTGEFYTLEPNAGPYSIAVGKDGALWFTESNLNRIGRITTSGTLTEYPLKRNNLGLAGIGVAPDGSIWFCENQAETIGRLVY